MGESNYGMLVEKSEADKTAANAWLPLHAPDTHLPVIRI
jgi:hypothetical protein